MRVEIDIWDILSNMDVEEFLDEMGDAKLKKYLEKRAFKTNIFQKKDEQLEQLFLDIYDALRTNNLLEVRAVLDAYHRPKWSSPELCERDYAKLKKESRAA